MLISDNLNQIKSQIPDYVTLVAVSKTKPNNLLMQAYDAGQRHFGENYVQELVDKSQQLPKDICWHFIGHLQSNKVKYLKSVLIKGFMAMASNTEDSGQIRKEFKSIHDFSKEFSNHSILSYGMSSDYQIAIEEGSNMIRVGSSIFGQR